MAGTRITQLTPMALPGRRYGDFSGKGVAPITPTTGLVVVIALDLTSQYTEALDLTSQYTEVLELR
jgi:hypothetical protein